MENELCYYCNLSTFKSIIENQTFWLSDIHFMNDSSEESLFLDALTDVMRNMQEKLSSSTKQHLNNAKDIYDLFTNIKHVYRNMAYICCFSYEINDDLSQWRGYANDGKGLCIGFKKEYIEKLSKPSDIKIIKRSENEEPCNTLSEIVFAQDKIKYSDKEHISKEIEETISPIVKNYDNNEKTGKIIKNFPDIWFYGKLHEKTYKYKVFYKNNSFESEKEYRICFFDFLHKDKIGKNDNVLMENMQNKYRFENGTELSELKYRESREKLIPYREMKFPKDYFKEMLSSITIGPKNPMSEEDVQYFLIANGFDTSNITIQKSASTYQ